jgi:hypothetical protein
MVGNGEMIVRGREGTERENCEEENCGNWGGFDCL